MGNAFHKFYVNEKVNLFHKSVKNIILNYIPHETITCDDNNPYWTNKDIRELIHEENQAYESCSQNKNNIFSLYQFEFLQSKSFCNRKI